MPSAPRQQQGSQSLVDFAIIGAMKSGTSTLFSWLAEHPDVSACSQKEPSFFSSENRWRRGVEWYDDLFPVQRRGARGEASTSYTHPELSKVSAQRIFDLAPEVRLVYLLRHPVERARSHYRHEVQRGREDRELVAALSDPHAPYLAQSSYWTCIEPYTHRFTTEQILVIRFEDLTGDDGDAWNAVQRHLGLAICTRPVNRANVTAEKRQFTPILRWLWERNLLPSRSMVPASVRRAAKRVLLRKSSEYERLLADSQQPVPIGLTAAMWDDVGKLDLWLGRTDPLWDHNS